MFIATMIVSVVLAAMLVATAVRKLGHAPDVVATYTRVGVPEARLNLLAAVLVAGAAGLVAGLAWAPLGIAAATGLVCYFAFAIGAHLRADDLKPLPTPVAFAVLAVAALVLRLATA